MAVEVTRADINRIHERIDTVTDRMDTMSENSTEIKVCIAKIQTKLEMAPPPPTQPCHHVEDLKKDFDGHVADHKENIKMIKRPVVRTVIELVKMGIVAAVTWLFVKSNK